MSIGAGEWEISVPPVDDPVLIKQREDIFIKLGLGLISFQYEDVARGLTALFEDKNTSETERQNAIDTIRFLIIESSRGSDLPTLGDVWGEAFKFADEDQALIPNLIHQYIEDNRPKPYPFTLDRRTPPAAIEVA